VAKICFVAGLTFWLGNVTVLGLGITIDPVAASAIDQLPAFPNRCFGVFLIVLLVSYIAWVWSGRAKSARRLEREIANGPTRCCRSASASSISALRARHVHAAAERAEHRIHNRVGGVRVGDLAGLCQSRARRVGRIRRHHDGRALAVRQGIVLAGLLLFRVLYYLVPFAIALTILGVREIWLNMHGMRRKAELDAVRTVTAPITSEIERKKTGAG